LNPLAEWTKREVWAYLGEHEVPVHGLYAQGYTSIGCAPCTRAIGEGEDDRAGRWWWATNAPKECGMHCSIEHGDDEAQALEELIELGLQSGRIRSVYGPEGEQAALKTFRRLPGGRVLAESASEVSEALSALEGKPLEHVRVQSTGPGSFLLTLGVEGLELS